MGEISKAEFITRQFQRTHNKRFENYVLTRIWHGVNSTDVKMITQQYVIREDGCALLDAYFQQFNSNFSPSGFRRTPGGNRIQYE